MCIVQSTFNAVPVYGLAIQNVYCYNVLYQFLYINQLTYPLKKSSSDLRSFGIKSNGNTWVNSMFLLVHLVCFANISHGLSVIFMRSKKFQVHWMTTIVILFNIFLPMRKVHPSNIHSILNEFQETFRGSANWSNGAHNS